MVALALNPRVGETEAGAWSSACSRAAWPTPEVPVLSVKGCRVETLPRKLLFLSLPFFRFLSLSPFLSILFFFFLIIGWYISNDSMIFAALVRHEQVPLQLGEIMRVFFIFCHCVSTASTVLWTVLDTLPFKNGVNTVSTEGYLVGIVSRVINCTCPLSAYGQGTIQDISFVKFCIKLEKTRERLSCTLE